jgi:pyridoxine 5-phosphate synthase
VPAIAALACEVRPDEATLVPEKRQELTTEGGLDVASQEKVVAPIVAQLQAAGIEVSLFLDPDLRQIEVARRLGVTAVEIQTATYSEARTVRERVCALDALRKATAHAKSLGLHVHMGHGLNYYNVQDVAGLNGVEELNIGHSIVSRAVLVGMERAVADMKRAIREGSARNPGEVAHGT